MNIYIKRLLCAFLICSVAFGLISCRTNSQGKSSSATSSKSNNIASENSSIENTSSAADSSAADEISTESQNTTVLKNPFDEIAGAYSSQLKSNLPRLKTADTLYYIKKSNLNTAEMVMIESLQGILAQNVSQIYILDNQYWFDYLSKNYNIKFVEYTDPWQLVNKFKSNLNDSGFVKFDFIVNETAALYADKSGSINKADTIAGMERYLVVESSIVNKALSIGLKLKADASIDYEYDIFRKYEKLLNKNMLFQQQYDNYALRDFGIATKALYFYDVSIEDQYYEVLDWVNPNGYIFGWHLDEVSGVKLGSQRGLATIASDHALNLSVYAGLPTTVLKQKITQKKESSSTNVHYVTFLGTDGDNVQYQVNGMYKNINGYGSPQRGTIPFGWGVSPAMLDIAPNCLSNLYKTQTPSDNFFAAVSGIGYVNPDFVQFQSLMKFTKLTSNYMKALDLNVVNLLLASEDKQLEDFSSENTGVNLQRIVKAYSVNDGISGGIVNYGDRYMPKVAYGGVVWSDGKPFVNTRETMWDNGLSKETFISQMAYRINHYAKDATLPEGYTAIMVHAWSYTYSDAISLSKLLDKDVIIVTPKEFISLMTKNIKNKKTKLFLDKPNDKVNDFDYSNAPVFIDTSFIDLDAVAKKTAETNTIFNFSNGMGSWVPVSMGAEYDKACISTYNGADAMQKVFFTDGSKFGANKNLVPNAYMYNKIKMPDVANLKMKINAAYNDVVVRIQVLDETNNFITVKDYTLKDNQKFTEWSVDFSRFRGKTVTVFYEVKDSCNLGRTSGGGENSWTAGVKFE